MPPVIRPPITTTVWRTDISCILCARVSGYVQDGHVQASAPETANEVARFRCPHCGGRLVTHGEAYPVRIFRKLTEQEQRLSKVGRPPKPQAQARLMPAPQALSVRPQKRVGAYLCAELCGRSIRRRTGRCQSCRGKTLIRWSRLIEALADGDSRNATELCAALGCSRESLRRFVHVARRAGYPIQGGRDSRRIGVYTLVPEATG